MQIEMKMEGKEQEELQEFFKDINSDKEFENKINQLEDVFTPKRKILNKCKKEFTSVLDVYIQGTLTKEKALLLLQSKYHQFGEKIKDMSLKGYFIEIDYEDGNGYIPEEFMKIANTIDYFYSITIKNIENADLKDVKLESFSSPAVKRVVKSIAASFDKYFGVEKTNSNENQSKQEILEQETTKPLITEKQAQQDIDKILGILIKKTHIIKTKDQYRITDGSSVPMIIAELRVQNMIGSIIISETEIYTFIKSYIKDKNGRDIKDAVNTAKNRYKNANKK